MRKGLIVYLLGAVMSWFLISGWTFAYFENNFPNEVRKHSGFAASWSVLASVAWPFFLPATYCLTGYAEHGWRPVWRLK
jgi:hypothetical protein